MGKRGCRREDQEREERRTHECGVIYEDGRGGVEAVKVSMRKRGKIERQRDGKKEVGKIEKRD